MLLLVQSSFVLFVVFCVFVRVKELEGRVKDLIERCEVLEQQVNESCTVRQVNQ